VCRITVHTATVIYVNSDSMFVSKKEEVIKTTWRIPKPLIKQMKQAALDNDTTVSQVVIQAFKEFLDKKEK
ncbi:MAG: hypothetical protein WBQ16_14230, partial [Nitrososphaeraceae archaeon]